MKAKGKRQEAKGKRPEGAARHPYFCLLTFAFCLLPPVFLSSEPINSLHATAYVNDFAGVIDAASKQQLEALCVQLDRKTAAQVTVVTIKSLDGEPI